MTQRFDHEKLKVYQSSIDFLGWTEHVLDGLPKGVAVRNQLDRAATSISLNIAEGNGKHSPADRCRYFDNARGSALECAACFDVLVAKGKVGENVANEGKRRLVEVVAMLVGLIRSNSAERSV